MAESPSSRVEGIKCCFCDQQYIELNPSEGLIPLSLKAHAFGHSSCLKSYFSKPCEFCKQAPLEIGEKVEAINLIWNGTVQSFKGDIIGFHPDKSYVLCFADHNELARIDQNPQFEDVIQKATIQNKREKPEPTALYELAVMKAYGLCGQVQNHQEAVALFSRAASLGHATSMLGIHVPAAHVMGLCRFHRSPTVEPHWRILPPHVLQSDQDVRPEEILDNRQTGGSSFSDAATAPDPLGRLHASIDMMAGAMGTTLRSMLATTSPLLISNKRKKLENNENNDIDQDCEALPWAAYLQEYFNNVDRCIDQIPGLDRSYEQQVLHIEALQKKLDLKKSELRQALVISKAEVARDRHAARKLLKVARHIDSANHDSRGIEF